MLKLSHATMIALSGLVWLVVGCALLSLGLKLVMYSAYSQGFDIRYPFLDFLTSLTGGVEQAALLLMAFSLYTGYCKAKFVLSKSVNRSINRIANMPNPSSIARIYSVGYYCLFGAMILLGMSIKWIGLPDDIRGAIDIAVGSALINGSILYFRKSLAFRKQPAFEVIKK